MIRIDSEQFLLQKPIIRHELQKFSDTTLFQKTFSVLLNPFL
jgi:hypothetical protein